MKIPNHGVDTDGMLPLDDLGGDDVVLEVRASRTVSRAGKQARTQGSTNTIRNRLGWLIRRGVRETKSDDETDTKKKSTHVSLEKCGVGVRLILVEISP